MGATITLTGNAATVQAVPAASQTATVQGLVSETPAPSQPFVVQWSDVQGKPTFGTAASRDVPAAGDASTIQAVLGADSRLTNLRHTISTMIDDASALGQSVLVSPNSASLIAILGLGTISTQNSNAVTITGGNITGVTVSGLASPLALASGGTGQTTQGAALTALLGSSAVPIANGGTGQTTQGAALTALLGSSAVPIANGGTGQTTQVNALSALLGSSAVPIANGGTGSTSAAAARTALNVAVIGPTFRARRITSSQSISNGAATEVVLNTTDFDTASCFNTANGRFTPNVAGYYEISVTGVTSAPSGTIVNGQVLIFKNGAIYQQVSAQLSYPSSIFGASGSDIVFLNGTTDYVSLFISNNSSGGTQTAEIGCRMSGVFLHP